MSVSRGSWRFEAIDEGSGPEAVADDGRLNLSTRRGKQFNSMVQEAGDALTGAGRDAVLISAADAGRLGIASGDPVVVRSDVGELPGTALIAPIAAGNVEVHWPEGNRLIGSERVSPEAGIPDYNARVEVSPAAAPA
jgi:anaerobic selenocysteine-containing dehydrogenase